MNSQSRNNRKGSNSRSSSASPGDSSSNSPTRLRLVQEQQHSHSSTPAPTSRVATKELEMSVPVLTNTAVQMLDARIEETRALLLSMWLDLHRQALEIGDKQLADMVMQHITQMRAVNVD